jgi:hypothetical protein
MANIIDDIVIMNALLECEELEEFYEYDMDNEAFREALGKVKKLEIKVYGNRKMFSQETLEQLNTLLPQMHNLKNLTIINRGKSERVDITSIFDNLEPSIERLFIVGCNIGGGFAEDELKKFEALKDVTFENIAISQIPVFPNTDRMIKLRGEILGITDVDCLDYGTSDKNRLIFISNEEVQQMIDAYAGEPLPIELYEKYAEYVDRFKSEICISLNDVNQLSLEKLEALKADERIKNITIQGGAYSYTDKSTWYSIEEYSAIRQEIDKIVESVVVPDEDDPDREKKIFAQVYKILGEKIDYDHYAISEEGKKDDKLLYDCRNLKNGLLGVDRNGQKQNLAVCAGYADILRNVLSCFGIKSEYVSSFAHVAIVEENGIWTEKTDENGKIIFSNGTTDPMAHAYNSVELDGQKYYCDLTWDVSNIKVGRYPLKNFLKSYESFLISHKDQGFNEYMADKEANVSLSYSKQFAIFDQIVHAQDKVEEMIQENYLSGFVSECLDAISQGEGTLTPRDFLDTIALVKRVEDSILTREEDKMTNMAVGLGEGQFVFETSNEGELKRLKNQISERRRRDSGKQSR